MDAPGEKLITAMWVSLVDGGVGSLLKPWQIRRESRAVADGRRHEALLLAQVGRDAEDVTAGRKFYDREGKLHLIEDPEVSTLTLPTQNSHVENGRIEPTLQLSPEFAQSKRHADEIRKEVNQGKAILFAEEILENDDQTPPKSAIEEDWLFAWRDNASKTSNENLQRLWGSVLAGEVKSP